jgi:hypothetical protein
MIPAIKAKQIGFIISITNCVYGLHLQNKNEVISYFVQKMDILSQHEMSSSVKRHEHNNLLKSYPEYRKPNITPKRQRNSKNEKNRDTKKSKEEEEDTPVSDSGDFSSTTNTSPILIASEIIVGFFLLVGFSIFLYKYCRSRH